MTIDVRTKGAFHLVVERSTPDGPLDGSTMADLAVEALFALADPLFQPLDVEVALVCCDAESGIILEERPHRPFRQLRLGGRDDGIDQSATYGNAVVETTDRLDRSTLRQWLGRQLTFQCQEPDSVPGWSELIVNSVDARVPAELPESGNLRLRYLGGDFPYPVRADTYGTWASGPLRHHSDTTPFHVTVSCDAGDLTIDASLTWSLWTSPEMPGHAALQRSMQALSALGWRPGADSDF